MKKCLALLLALLLCVSALAEGSVVLALNGVKHTLTLEERNFSDGVLTLRVSGFDVLEETADVPVAPAWIYIRVDGYEIQPVSAECDSEGVYTYTVKCAHIPNEIYIFADGAEDLPALLWRNPDYEAHLSELAAIAIASSAVKEQPIEEVLEALAEPAYLDTLEALQDGGTIGKGTNGKAAKGLQMLLIAFGEDIKADASIGPKTLEALNRVQAAFGFDQTETVDEKVFEQLLRALLKNNQ